MIDADAVVLHLVLSFEEDLTGNLIVMLFRFLDDLVDRFVVEIVVRGQTMFQRRRVPMSIRTSVIFIHAGRRILNDLHATVRRVRGVFAFLTVGMPNVIDVFPFELSGIHSAGIDEFVTKEFHAFIQRQTDP